ncbi:MAG: GNAT family N-acetyltransferase, partial [Bacteroidetes bacterium]|nr:GNAT family N-acetyltransferase [Bacteroidota bacterium]
MTICQPDASEFIFIKDHIEKFELDNRDLQNEQFLVVKDNNEITAFGRIKKHNSCDELCSLGVIEPKRLKGIGKRLSFDLIKKSLQPLYLVCIIPQFFEPLGFKIVNTYP